MEIGERIRQARDRKGLTQEQLGEEVGVTDSAVNQWEAGTSAPATKNLPKIASALGVTKAWLLDGDDPAPQKPIASFLERDLPVYGASLSGSGTLMLNRGDEIDRVHRPGNLANVRDAFGVVVSGDSMEPKYMKDEIVHVHPGRPPRPRQGVVIEFHDGHAELKEFVSQDDNNVRCRQYNPPKELRYKTADIKRLYRVVGCGEYQ